MLSIPKRRGSRAAAPSYPGFSEAGPAASGSSSLGDGSTTSTGTTSTYHGVSGSVTTTGGVAGGLILPEDPAPAGVHSVGLGGVSGGGLPTGHKFDDTWGDGSPMAAPAATGSRWGAAGRMAGTAMRGAGRGVAGAARGGMVAAGGAMGVDPSKTASMRGMMDETNTPAGTRVNAGMQAHQATSQFAQQTAGWGRMDNTQRAAVGGAIAARGVKGMFRQSKYNFNGVAAGLSNHAPLGGIQGSMFGGVGHPQDGLSTPGQSMSRTSAPRMSAPGGGNDLRNQRSVSGGNSMWFMGGDSVHMAKTAGVDSAGPGMHPTPS